MIPTNDYKKLRILCGYSWPKRGYISDFELAESDKIRLRKEGFDVDFFCLTLNPPGPCLSFKEMDRMWKWGEKNLLKMYENLLAALEGKDVFINLSGINLHPEFVESLNVFTVFQCFDDPESSEILSKPVAHAYDLSLVGNIAEVETYRSWGVRNVEWTPLGVPSYQINPDIAHESILQGQRDIDLFMIADKLSPWRKARLDALDRAFPKAHFYGNGWARGMLPLDQEMTYLSRAKIGPNLHNSTGPINSRTFYLPANGVMQICDNKKHLGSIFALGKEVVGFDNVKECIDLCRYYLEHDDERRAVAAAGWKRAVTEYNDIAIFDRKMRQIGRTIPIATSRVHGAEIKIRQQREKTALWGFGMSLLYGTYKLFKRIARSMLRISRLNL